MSLFFFVFATARTCHFVTVINVHMFSTTGIDVSLYAHMKTRTFCLQFFAFIPYSMLKHLNNDQLSTDFSFLILHQIYRKHKTPVSQIQRIMERAQTTIILLKDLLLSSYNNPHVTVFFHFKHNKVLFLYILATHSFNAFMLCHNRCNMYVIKYLYM